MTAAPLRVFVSTGEASGEVLAADLIGAMRARGVAVEADGFGGERLERAGVRLARRTAGWASMGPIDALAKIPKLLAIAARTAVRLRANPPDLIVLVDFGAFNLRFARMLRTLGVSKPILYYFPPAAWLDDARRARAVAALTDPMTAFAHQRDFYHSLGLPIGYAGHPLVSTIAPRPPRPPAPAGGGVVALLPGSRAGEISRHTPRLLNALALLREQRPGITAVLAAADAAAYASFEELLRLRSPLPVQLVRSAREALAEADVAAVASGTAVLEAGLLEVPSVALYVLSDAQAKIARRVYRRPFVTLPNLVLGRAVVPELLQEAATPRALADALETLLAEPDAQRNDLRELRAALGPPDALDRCAQFALGLAGR
jgi:lipid-A-disaccharide synthase